MSAKTTHRRGKVCLRTDDGTLGRYWVAAESVEPGTLILEETASVCVPNCEFINDTNGCRYVDPIRVFHNIDETNKNGTFCRNCCKLFSNTAVNHHYCSQKCSDVCKYLYALLRKDLYPCTLFCFL